MLVWDAVCAVRSVIRSRLSTLQHPPCCHDNHAHAPFERDARVQLSVAVGAISHKVSLTSLKGFLFSLKR